MPSIDRPPYAGTTVLRRPHARVAAAALSVALVASLASPPLSDTALASTGLTVTSITPEAIRDTGGPNAFHAIEIAGEGFPATEADQLAMGDGTGAFAVELVSDAGGAAEQSFPCSFAGSYMSGGSGNELVSDELTACEIDLRPLAFGEYTVRVTVGSDC